jgi:hypothetical protein
MERRAAACSSTPRLSQLRVPCWWLGGAAAMAGPKHACHRATEGGRRAAHRQQHAVAAGEKCTAVRTWLGDLAPSTQQPTRFHAASSPGRTLAVGGPAVQSPFHAACLLGHRFTRPGHRDGWPLCAESHVRCWQLEPNDQGLDHHQLHSAGDARRCPGGTARLLLNAPEVVSNGWVSSPHAWRARRFWRALQRLE